MTAPDNAVQAARERLMDDAARAGTTSTTCVWTSDLRVILAALTTAERDRDAAIKSASDGGEAQGSETAGVVEGWRRRAEEAERLARESLAERDQAMFVADCAEAHALAKAAKLTWPDDVLDRVDEWINRKHGGDGTLTDIARALIACARNPGADGVIAMLNAEDRRAAALAAAAEGTGDV